LKLNTNVQIITQSSQLVGFILKIK
jgi:hypothetical protein